jgi:hypothetical protein
MTSKSNPADREILRDTRTLCGPIVELVDGDSAAPGRFSGKPAKEGLRCEALPTYAVAF